MNNGVNFDMRALIVTAGILCSQVSFGCVIARIVPDGAQSAEGIERAFLRQSFQAATIVVEASVISINRAPGFSLVRIQPGQAWKTDGKPIELVYQEPPGPCSEDELEVGGRYILFAKRKLGMLEYVKTSSVPISLLDSVIVLGVSAGQTSEVKPALAISDIRSYLAQLSVVWILPAGSGSE